jgi:hypothetical protein
MLACISVSKVIDTTSTHSCPRCHVHIVIHHYYTLTAGGLGRDRESAWNQSNEIKDLEYYVPEIARDALNPLRRRNRTTTSAILGCVAPLPDEGIVTSARGPSMSAPAPSAVSATVPAPGKILKAFIHERVARSVILSVCFTVFLFIRLSVLSLFYILFRFCFREGLLLT